MKYLREVWESVCSTCKNNKKKVLGIIIILFCIILAIILVCKINWNKLNNRNNMVFAPALESLVSRAVINYNVGSYLSGETNAEGHIILDVTTNIENNIEKNIIYALTSYGEYGFENGIFTKVSGTGIIPVRITCEKVDNSYRILEYKMPLDGAGYTDSIKKIFPSNLVDRAINYTDSDADRCYEQEEIYAKQYLAKIGRNATVSSEYVNKVLDRIDVELSNSLLDLFHDYPYWIGTEEKLEHDTRFVYERIWEDQGSGKGILTLKKYKYDDNSVVEEYVIEINGKDMSYLKGVERTTRNENSIAKEIKLGNSILVDLDGDGNNENIYYGLDDFKINGISYKNNIEDVYIDNPNQYSFIITDINKEDAQKEIVLKVDGPSDDPAAHFYTYKNTLIKLGKAETELNYTSFDGEGNIYGDVRLSILQTWFAPESWSLKDNKIVRNTDHIYYPNQYALGSEVILLEDLPVYKELTDSSLPSIMKPQIVKLTKTDNKKYCYAEGEDGTAGWFEVTEFFRIVELGNKPATDVFDGLCMAD